MDPSSRICVMRVRASASRVVGSTTPTPAVSAVIFDMRPVRASLIADLEEFSTRAKLSLSSPLGLTNGDLAYSEDVSLRVVPIKRFRIDTDRHFRTNPPAEPSLVVDDLHQRAHVVVRAVARQVLRVGY